MDINLTEVVELTRQLIRIDTSNPPGNEAPAMRHLGAYLSQWGIDVEYVEVEPGRPNLFARLRGEGNSGHLVFSGHMDVVPPGNVPWDHDPFTADLVGTRIVGRGATDMKGGLAAMAVALTMLARARFRPIADVILAVSVGEEVLGPGARHMAATRALAGSRYLVVGEPTALDVCIAQKGATRWNITAHGVAAHASTPTWTPARYATRQRQFSHWKPVPTHSPRIRSWAYQLLPSLIFRVRVPSTLCRIPVPSWPWLGPSPVWTLSSWTDGPGPF